MKYAAPLIRITPEGCWVTGLRGLLNGYVQIHTGNPRRKPLLHRLAFEAFHGPIPPGMRVLHSCDNPPCGSPEHVRAGTQKENMAESIARGRLTRGPTLGRRLTPDEVRAIRVAEGTQHAIAARFGTTYQTVSLIKRGRIWRSV
jgi:hypothetical protein